MSKSKSERNKLYAKILRRANAILNRQKAWTKHTEARDCDGLACAPESKQACSFCATGAVKRAIFEVKGKPDFALFNDLREHLDNETRHRTSRDSLRATDSVVNYNDWYAKDKRYIIRLFNATLNRLTSK